MVTYIIRAGADGPVKIGKAADPYKRLIGIQVSHPEKLTLLRVIDTDFDAERVFHDRFAAQHIRGEWFSYVEEMMTFIPPRPHESKSVDEIMQEAKAQALAEVRGHIEELWTRFRVIDSRDAFKHRLARLLKIKPSRAKKIIYGEPVRLHIHEMEGLRAIVRKVRMEDARANDRLPLFTTDREDN